jgi:DnaK suppressor protein
MTEHTAERQDTLRQMLLERRHALQREIDESLVSYRTAQQRMSEESVADAEDQAIRNSTGDQRLSLLEARNRTREQFDEALRRLNEGCYGLCQHCGSQIKEGRLKAIPFALRCRECQEQAEFIEQIERREDREMV